MNTMKAKKVKSKFIEMVCDDGRSTGGVRFYCPGFVGELPVSAVNKVGGVKAVKELVAAYVGFGIVGSDLDPWLEDGTWEAVA